MEIFLVTLCFLIMVGSGIFLVLWIIGLSETVKLHSKEVQKLEEELYAELRLVQYNAKDCCKTIKKLIGKKDSLLKELLADAVIMFLPFRKIKKVLLAGKLIKKFL